MRVPKVYIETSVFNFVFADDAPEKRQDTLALFDEIRQGRYIPYASDTVIGELDKATEPKRTKMLSLIGEYGLTVLPVTSEALLLARLYIAESVIPQKYATDSIHIAVASVQDLDFIISFNFKHIVKRKTITMTEAINLREGYKRIGIFSPTEVIDNDD